MNTYGIRSDFRTGQFVPQVSGKDVSPTSFDEVRALEIARQIAEDIDAGRAPADPSEQEQTLAYLRREMGECVDGLSIRESVALLVSQRENARNAHVATQGWRGELEAALRTVIHHYAPDALVCQDWVFDGNTQTDNVLRMARAALHIGKEVK